MKNISLWFRVMLELYFLLNQALKSVDRYLAHVLKQYDLTLPQYLVLQALYLKDGQTATELVETIQSDNATLTAIIDRLERKFFVRRQSSPKDRRKKIIVLTDKARAIEHSLSIKVEQFFGQLNQQLDPKELKELKSGLQKITFYFSDIYEWH
ncbi:MarR family transcriptional regulator [candidate division KSB1 bacterium]|jgi:MarR family 2-MHQ and catechol resistance regulon transcriptional repressor|nr:MarR family transcriptional regulator [candidate division KSB1 bacterium]